MIYAGSLTIGIRIFLGARSIAHDLYFELGASGAFFLLLFCVVALIDEAEK
jgi:hypothetical protein